MPETARTHKQTITIQTKLNINRNINIQFINVKKESKNVIIFKEKISIKLKIRKFPSFCLKKIVFGEVIIITAISPISRCEYMSA